MATVTGFTAERMLEIENSTIVDGYVDDSGELVLKTREGIEIPAGHVRGEDATALMGVTDSTSFDFALTGAGTPSDPWNLTGNVKALPSGAIVTGVLEASYRAGPAKVKVGGVLSSVAYPWATAYIPGGSREVTLMKVGTSWLILGQTMDNYREITYNPTYAYTYNEGTATNTFANLTRAIKSSAGIVSLSGLIRVKGTPAAATALAYIPEGFRPDTDMLVPAESNGSITIKIKTDGVIEVYQVPSANAYISLDGICYPAAGVADWTEIGSSGSGSSFASVVNTNEPWNELYGYPAYWKDPYGFVWFRGLLRINSTLSVDNTLMVTLPTSHRADAYQHLRAASQAGYAGIGYRPDDGLVWKSNSASTIGNWISLAGLIGVTSDGRANNLWRQPSTFTSGWVNVGTINTNTQFVRREDGLCMLNGLVKTGTPPSKISVLLDEEMWPTRGRIIFATTSNNAHGRLDLASVRDDTLPFDLGAIVAQTGSSTWFSLDGRAWTP